KILVSGSLCFDKIMNFPGYFKDHILPDKIHNLNVSFSVENLKENFGGTAGNIAYNLALLGESPEILSTAGKDFDDYKKWLKKYGVDTEKIKIIDDKLTSFCNIITDQADNQLTAFYPGAMADSWITGNMELDSSDKILAIIAPGHPGDIVKLSKLYSENNIPFIFDPGQQIPTLSGEDLKNSIKGAKVFISNDYELSLVLRKTNWSEKEILNNAEIIITTLGEKGSIIKTQKENYEIQPAKPKNTSDPTGAGDAYRAGLIKGLIEGWPIDVVGRFGGVVSCYTVEKYGTQTHKFSFDQVKKRYNKNFNI
ncbi:MAG: carbohydrate kinase family protein, partial [Candidatus Pacebacteria bacterium]|nr:carbohydrate kinase family protein [Candidatus Paceibacterota bacterium]